MIAGSAAYQIKYYVLAVPEWFSHGLGRKQKLSPIIEILELCTKPVGGYYLEISRRVYPFDEGVSAS